VQKQGMLAWQYNTIGVSDAITMGGEGTFGVKPSMNCLTGIGMRFSLQTREIIADSIEVRGTISICEWKPS